MASRTITKLGSCIMVCGSDTLTSGEATVRTGLTTVLSAVATLAADSETIPYVEISGGDVTFKGESGKDFYYQIVGI